MARSGAPRPAALVPARASGAVRQAVRERLATVATPMYRAVLRAPLTRRGRLLTGTTPPWASLPLAVAAAVGGAWQPAVPVAAAMELTAAALELLDDLEDDEIAPDDPIQALSPARRLNASTGLLTLALSTLDGDAGRRLAEAVVVATTGQDEDLAGSGVAVDEETCLRIAGAKTAGLTSCAAYLGAAAAGSTPEVAAAYARFGQHLGLAGQFANDLEAVDPSRLHPDIIQRKPTILLAAAGLIGQDDRPLAEPSSAAAVSDHLHASGAVAYVWMLAEAECQEALAELETLAGLGHEVDALRRFVRSIAVPPDVVSRPAGSVTHPAATSAPPAYPAAASAAAASPAR